MQQKLLCIGGPADGQYLDNIEGEVLVVTVPNKKRFKKPLQYTKVTDTRLHQAHYRKIQLSRFHRVWAAADFTAETVLDDLITNYKSKRKK